MPEGGDVFAAAKAISEVLPLEFGNVLNCYTPHTEVAQQKRIDFVKQIKKPSIIKKAWSHGHYLFLDTDKQYFKFQLGTGSYWDCVPLESLKFYPYKAHMNILFLHIDAKHPENSRALTLLDVSQTTNQVHMNVSDVPFLKDSLLGPCVLTENELFRDNLLQKWSQNPLSFDSMSVAAMLSDPSLFNGYGGYSITETLHRLYVRAGILPQDTAGKVMSDPKLRQFILDAPTLLEKELNLYNQNYNPANLGPKQQYLKRKFRFDFLKWYQQHSYEGKPVQSFVLYQNKRWRTFWTSTVPIESISKLRIDKNGEVESYVPITTKTGLTLTKPRHQDKMAMFELPCKEIWYVIQGKRLTPKSLGVGPHDWHSHASVMKLLSEGLPINQLPKGPAYTVGNNGKNSHAKKKRSSHKAISIKRKKYQQTGSNKKQHVD